ncbi:NUDIX domain-containing protein [Haloglomus litoreum]|uniref:NUDIX domain-containing protein n=1 Tax=Haloglomus litoreum TaxID=3034026 RepID=UPI0023E7BA1F|nr:NUDIX domain-containing protein [Haloglomus sp. DT116]
MSDEGEEADGASADADETGVVTVFLRNDSDVLLCRRSDAVGSYSGQWGAVAGHAEGDPGRLAREEISEETGIDPDDCAFVRRGPSFPVEDPDHGTWRVTPFLFDCPTREVTTNRETTEHEWVQPPAILDRETVPRLWESYRRVAPTVADVREDREHGSEYVSRRAVEVLRDAAAALDAGVDAPVDLPDWADWSRLATLADALLVARESMAVVGNRVDRAMWLAAGEHEHGWDGSYGTPVRSAGAVRQTAEHVLANLEPAQRRLVGDARRADWGDGVVATLSRSGTVRSVLEAVAARVVVAESRPGGEGRAVARALADALIAPVTLCADAGVAHALDACDADAVLVGADTVLVDGSVVNKVGTRTLASAAAAGDVPVYVATHTDKVAPAGHETDLEPRDAGELLGDDEAPAGLRVENPTFDVTPPALVDGYCTEAGFLDAGAIRRVAERAAEHADWPRP